MIVFDDAEELEGSEESLAVLDQLLARSAPLSVAIAARRPPPLRLAKLRAGGRLLEIGPAELGFGLGECEQLLSLRNGRPVSEDEVEAAFAASQGWPMGVALTALTGAAARRARRGPCPRTSCSASSRRRCSIGSIRSCAWTSSTRACPPR